MSPTSDDAHLLAAWHDKRDEGAFQALCDRHCGLIETTCRRYGSSDTTEAVQAVFLVLARKAGTVPAANLGGWLIATAQHVVRHQHRASARHRRHEEEAAVEQVRQRTSDASEPSWADARQHLDAALANLSVARREAVLRFYLEGKPQAQVAAELGCTVDAVKTRVHEGLEHLRAFFTRRGVTMGAAVLASGLASEAAASEPALIASCMHAVLTPATAPHAAALAHGVTTAMIIKTATLVAAGFLLVGTCIFSACLIAADAPPVRSGGQLTVAPTNGPQVDIVGINPATNYYNAWDGHGSNTWRYFETWQTEVVRTANAGLIRVDPFAFSYGSNPLAAASKIGGSPFPPSGWQDPEFDDNSWVLREKPLSENGYRATALVCARTRFEVTDLAKVGDLTFTARFIGGLVVYVNGRECGRAALPEGKITPETLAQEYGKDAYVGDNGKVVDIPGDATFANISRWYGGANGVARYARTRVRDLSARIPASALRNGVNVLAVEVHRAPADEVMFAGLRKNEFIGSHAGPQTA